MWYILNLDNERAQAETGKCEQSVLKFEYGSVLNFKYFKSFQHNDDTNANGRQAKHDSDIGQDKETLVFKSLLYLNVAVHIKSVDCFTWCICRCSAWFRQGHGFNPSCKSHQLPVYLKYSVCLKLLAQLVHIWECKTFCCFEQTPRGLYPRDGSKMPPFY